MEKLRKKTTTHFKNKRDFLQEMNYKSIQQAKNHYDQMYNKKHSNDETYKLLVEDYNTGIDFIRENEKIERKDNKKKTIILKNQKAGIIQNFMKKTSVVLGNKLENLMFVLNKPKNIVKCLQVVKGSEITTPYEVDDIYRKKVRNYYFKVTSIENMKESILKLYNDKIDKVFRLQLSLGYVFEKAKPKNDEKDEVEKNEDVDEKNMIYDYVAFQPSITQHFTIDNNGQNMSLAKKVIRNREGLLTTLEKISLTNIESYLQYLKPSSATRIIGINSMCVKIMELEHNIGQVIPIPDYIKSNRNIVNLETNNNLCFWSCLAYHNTKNRRCIKEAKQMWETFYGKKMINNYEGFDIHNEVNRFEDLFQIGVNVYELEDDETLKWVRKSLIEDNIVSLLLYESHFLYIPDVNKIQKTKYMCNECGHTFPDMANLKRHTHVCAENVEQKDVFVKYPQIYEPTRNIIVELNEIFDTKFDIKYDYFIVYDFEAIVVKMNSMLGVSTHIPSYQKAVSVSICSNIEGFTEPFFLENEKVKNLYDDMFDRLTTMCKTAIDNMSKKFEYLFDLIYALSEKTEKEKRFKFKLIKNLENYISSVPVIGFNSGKYDINLNINEFMESLAKRSPVNEIFAIKNGNSFKALKSGQFLFLDVCQYLPPGYNLDQYIKAFNPNGLQKSIFPYEYIDSYEKLNRNIDVLKKDHFFSSLKKKHITDKEWNEFVLNKEKYQWKTIKDLLKFYNNLDVQPFRDAILNHRNFFYSLNIEMFKDGFSLPGLAEKIMFSYELKEFNEVYSKKSIPFSKTLYQFSNWDVKRSSYKMQDKNKGIYDKKLFIDEKEIVELNKQQYSKCYYCWKKLDDESWSLDRINNDEGHNTNNCVISCVNCNIHRADQHFKVFYRKKSLLRYSYKKPLIYLIDEENKEAFYKIKNNIVGGPSIVFHRHHRVNKTHIRHPVYENNEWKLGTEGSKVKNIVGYDANALYLWCIGNSMPCGELKWIEKNIENLDEIQAFINIMSDCEFYEVDIHTPEALYNEFGEFPLIFKNTVVNGSRKLISSFKGEKILIKGKRLKFLIEKGLKVTKFHGYIECTEGRPFKEFMEKVSNERRKGDVNPDHAIIAEMWKLVGNSAFGRTGMNKSKFSKVVYGSESKYNKEIGSYLFKDANQYGETFEITKKTKTVKQNIPIQVAGSIYDDAKLRMSEFYYDCVKKYIDFNNFQYIQMDTDSAYIALAGKRFDDLIKPEMLQIYLVDKNNWFLRTDTKENYAYDYRTAGLFKPEAVLKTMTALASKCYIGLDEKGKIKSSSKGVQSNQNKDILTIKSYEKVLKTGKPQMAINKGMRILSEKQINGVNSDAQQNRAIYNYTVNKVGLTSNYDKRIVLEDGISTIPLSI